MWKSRFAIILALLVILIPNGHGLSRIDPLVDTKVGLIRGLRANDGNYSMFMGIPYATVDKSNPFGASTPHPKFDEAFKAYDDSAICPQLEEFNNTIVGTLDCLHLNIYVPNSANSKNPLPVLVWIYGGGFTRGFSGKYVYGPRYLVRHDVILVTINYRLGPYGFMCLNTPDVPGNQGLKDQVLALRWVKDNIEAFGGDPNKITLFGESAGGSSVDFHLIFGKEKLFDKLIMQSGSALSPWALKDRDTTAHFKLSEHLGFTTSNTDEALNFLSTIDTNLLIASSVELGIKFRACVERDFDNVERFIYDYPVNIRNLNPGNIPILIGYNSDEGLLQYVNMTPEDFETSNVFYDHFKEYLHFDEDALPEMLKTVRHYYIGDEIISKEVEPELIKFHSDFYFIYPVVRTIEKYVENGGKNIYHYVFFHDGNRNFVKHRLNSTFEGAAHADEIGYLFDISYMNEEPTPEDQLIIDRITTLWTNFAKFGNPTPEITELLPVQWLSVTKDSLYYLQVDSELKVEKRNFRDRMAFWELFYKLNPQAQLGYEESNK